MDPGAWHGITSAQQIPSVLQSDERLSEGLRLPTLCVLLHQSRGHKIGPVLPYGLLTCLCLVQALEGEEVPGAAEQGNDSDDEEARKMAETSSKALQQQHKQDIPFREDYFLPEDEAGTTGTLCRDEVSSDEAESEHDDSAAPPVSGSKVGKANNSRRATLMLFSCLVASRMLLLHLGPP